MHAPGNSSTSDIISRSKRPRIEDHSADTRPETQGESTTPKEPLSTFLSEVVHDKKVGNMFVLSDGYHEVPLKDEDRNWTTFAPNLGTPSNINLSDEQFDHLSCLIDNFPDYCHYVTQSFRNSAISYLRLIRRGRTQSDYNPLPFNNRRACLQYITDDYFRSGCFRHTILDPVCNCHITSPDRVKQFLETDTNASTSYPTETTSEVPGQLILPSFSLSILVGINLSWHTISRTEEGTSQRRESEDRQTNSQGGLHSSREFANWQSPLSSQLLSRWVPPRSPCS